MDIVNFFLNMYDVSKKIIHTHVYDLNYHKRLLMVLNKLFLIGKHAQPEIERNKNEKNI